jgi:membrane fusion protein (multidrug efflux system)
MFIFPPLNQRFFRALLRTGAAVLLCTSCDRKEAASAPPPVMVPKVWVTKVAEREFADQVEALGTVQALEAINISANVTERVTALHFSDGQTVEKGALLAELSSDEEAAMLEGANVNLAEQEREVNRLRALANDGAVSQVRLQEYLTARDLALQKIEEAKAQLTDRQITAPFAGVLGFRRVSIGALVAPGDVIATLDFIDTVKLDFSVPETFLSDLEPGMTIEALSSAFPADIFKGTVTDIDSRVNPVTRAVIVRAEIPNPDHKLRAGMLLTTRVKKNPGSSPAIPERALVSVQSNHFVFAVDGTRVKRLPVTLGRRQPGFVEITGGADVGTSIVADGTIGLRDGAEVIISGEARAPAESYSPTREK